MNDQATVLHMQFLLQMHLLLSFFVLASPTQLSTFV